MPSAVPIYTPPMLLAAAGDTTWFATVVFVLDWLLRLGTAVRVVMRRQPVEVALSWLVIVLLIPFVGVGVYWAFGEVRIGKRKARRAMAVHEPYRQYHGQLRESPAAADRLEQLDPRFRPVARQAEQVAGVPALPGNALELMPSSVSALQRIAEAIRRAERTVDLLYYIFLHGGASEPVFDALREAAGRGVRCRVLVDALGSRAFLKSKSVHALRGAGVEVRAALPARVWRLLIQRVDVRNHRKLAVIDGCRCFTGSMNLVGPRRLRASVGVGPWIDAVVQVEGPALGPLYATFLEDWETETDEHDSDLDAVTERAMQHRPGDSWVQVVPTGPYSEGQSIRELLMSVIYAARKQLTLTTPYFVPDDAFLVALTSAASRGVDVTVIVPDRLDSALAYHAGNAHLGALLEAGVTVARYRGGVLHTKSITVDDAATLLGTVNLDMRSFYLNFELSLLVYDAGFTRQTRELQQTYLDRSAILDLEQWNQRPLRQRLLENTFRLAGPLL